MKTEYASVISLFSLFSACKANFDIYEVGVSNSLTPPIFGWGINDAEPSCDEVVHSTLYGDKKDVSGDKTGFRCKGDCGEGQHPGDIDELEFNTGDYHFTLYADRNFDLDTTKGETQGHCYPFPDQDKECRDGPGEIIAYRKFRCETDYTAADMQG